MLRQFVMAAGLALLPILAHAQSGVTFPAGNSMGFSIGGIEQVRVTADGRMGISTTAPHASAALDISMTTHGVLLPRLTTTQRMALSNPAEGLMVYDTGYNVLSVYAQQAWRNIGGGTSSQMPTYTNGYFVLVSGGFTNGNLGGISGANTICYNQLNASPWKGKEQSIYGHPDLDATAKQSRTRAFLCSSAGCQNPVPSTSYYFATQSSTSLGGALAFTTDGSGNAPGNSTAWCDNATTNATRFQCAESCDNDGCSYSDRHYRTGRNTGTNTNFVTSNHSSHCSSWTSSSSGVNGRYGTIGWSTTTSLRWQNNQAQCNQNYPIICMVDPL